MQKEVLFKKNTYQKDIEGTSLSKLTKLISSDMEKNCSKYFSDTSNTSDIEEGIIKQINTLKSFYIECLRLSLRNLLYRKKKITVKKKLI